MSVALPSSMDFRYAESQIIDSISVGELRIKANGGLADSSAVSVAGTAIVFEIPPVPNSALEPDTLVVRGRLGLTVSNHSPGVALTSAGIYSAFSRQVLSVNGIPLETINNPSIYTNIEWSGYGYDCAEREAQVGMLMNYNSIGVDASGWELAPLASKTSLGYGPFTHNTTSYVDFCMPISCVLTRQNKLIPSHLGKFEFEFTVSDITTMVLPLVTSAVASAFSLDRMELCVNRVSMPQDVWNKYVGYSPERPLTLKTVGVMYSALSLAANSSGLVELQIPLTLQSVKRIVWSCTNSTVREKIHGGLNPNLLSWGLSIDSKIYPSRRINLDARPSELAFQNDKCMASVYGAKHCNIPRAYSSIAHSAYSTGWTAASATTAFTAQLYTTAVSNRTFFMLDLEQINARQEHLFNGVRFPGHGSTLLQLEVGADMNEAYTIHLFTVYDCNIVYGEDRTTRIQQ